MFDIILKGKDGNEYRLGLAPAGVLVYEVCRGPGEVQMNKIGLFVWYALYHSILFIKVFLFNRNYVYSDDNFQPFHFIFKASLPFQQ